MIRIPFDRDENKLRAVFVGSVVFVKDSVSAISGSVGSILDSLRHGLVFLVQYSLTDDTEASPVLDRDLFENDI